MSQVLEPDIQNFIETHRRAFLVTVTSGRAPTVHPLTVVDGDHLSLFFNTYRKSAKVRNLARESQVACVVASADAEDPFRAVEVRGTAEVIETEGIPSSLAQGEPGDSAGVMLEENLQRVRQRLAAGKRVYVRLSVTEARFCEVVRRSVAPTPYPTGTETFADGTWIGPTRPSAIVMSRTEVATFLHGKQIAILGTVDQGGRPNGTPVRYTVGPGRLALIVPASDPARQNIADSKFVCATVEEFPTYETIAGVMVHGETRPAGPDEWRGWSEPIPPGFEEVTLFPGRVVSFDFKKIHQPRQAPSDGRQA
jgi:nitroimidazol reductase NimA-like FMN-containing flavoprotein (pyridoxamine 5'-phosphate oxidase superfamily)